MNTKIARVQILIVLVSILLAPVSVMGQDDDQSLFDIMAYGPDSIREDVRVVLGAIVTEMRGLELPKEAGEILVFDEQIRQGLHEGSFDYGGFRCIGVVPKTFRNSTDDYQTKILEGTAIFRDQVGRTTIIEFQTSYHLAQEKIIIREASCNSLYPSHPNTMLFFVPAEAVSANLIETQNTHAKLLKFISENALTKEQLSTTSGKMQKYFVFACTMDRIANEAKLGLLVSQSNDGSIESAQESMDINYDGWHVAILRGQFKLNIEPEFFFKAIYKPGNEAPLKEKKMQVISSFSSMLQTSPGSSGSNTQVGTQHPLGDITRITDYPQAAKNITGAPCGIDRTFVFSLFQCILERDPEKKELDEQVRNLQSGMSRKEMVIRFFKSKEYLNKMKSGRESYKDAFQAVLGRNPSSEEISAFPRTWPFMMAMKLFDTEEYRNLCQPNTGGNLTTRSTGTGSTGGTPGGGANLVTNGSFEQGRSAGSSYLGIKPGSTDLPGWQITGKNVDVVGSAWKSSHGPAQGTARLLTGNSNQDMVGPNETYRGNGKFDAIFRAQFSTSNRTVTAVEVRNTNGIRSIWDTRANNRLWLGGVVIGGRAMNRSDGSVNFSLDSGQNTLDFFVEDNGSIRGGKTNYRMTIFFASGDPLIMDIVPANSSNTPAGTKDSLSPQPDVRSTAIKTPQRPKPEPKLQPKPKLKPKPVSEDGYQSIGLEAAPAPGQQGDASEYQRKIPKGHSTKYGF